MAKGQKKGASSSGASKKSSFHAHGGNKSDSLLLALLSDNQDAFALEQVGSTGGRTVNDKIGPAQYLIAWKEIGQGVAFLFVCALMFMAMRVGVYVAFRIQYLQDAATTAPSSSMLFFEESLDRRAMIEPPPQWGFHHHHRITVWDPFIAHHNKPLRLSSRATDLMQPTKAPEGNTRVSRGQIESPLMLIDESPPLSLGPISWSNELGDDGATTIVSDSSENENMPLVPMDPPVTSFQQYASTKVKRVLCRDGRTYGYEKWETLTEAFQAANAYSSDRFMRWNKYFATTKDTFQGVFANPVHYYEEDIVLTICPDTTIFGTRGPVAFVNAGNIVLHCERCTIKVKYGSHFSFGPHAKNILFRGVTFRGSSTSSLLFHHDGADVSFEDCYFLENSASLKQLGTVADVNSTSVVNFYRCLMKNGPNDRSSGSTSLSIRAKDAEL